MVSLSPTRILNPRITQPKEGVRQPHALATIITMSEKTVLITGAAGGIGSATVDVFAELGWRVLAVDRRELGRDLPANVEFIQTDIAEPANIEELAAIVQRLASAGLDVLVNNAALQVAKALADTELDEWEAQIAVNLRAPWLITKALYPLIEMVGGAVVHVSSVHALQTSAELGAYAASKGGLMAMMRTMAIEYAPTVRVNAVLPGPVDTMMLRDGLKRGGQSREKLEQKVLLKRIAEPAEIARAIYFLADNQQSSYITGQSLVVDGGAMARLSIE